MADILENPVDLIDDAYEQEIQVEQEPIEVTAYRSYNQLDDKPQINGVELIGNKTSSDLGITAQINSAVDSEAQTRQQADSTLQGKIDAEETARKAADKDIQDVLDGETLARQNADTALGGRIDTEIHDRQVADIGLQGQIDAITSKSDVVDVVADYAALQAYDTQHLGNNDVIKVLDDETHNDTQTYYRWNKTAGTWSYIGSEAPYYSKGQIDQQMLGKQDKLTAGTGITLDGSTISADTTVLATKEDLEPENVAELPAEGDTTKLYLTPTIKTASGNPITIGLKENVGQLTSFRLDGDACQQNYTGKNLLGLGVDTSTQGLNVSLDTENNSITLSGTTINPWPHLSDRSELNIPAGTYTMSIKSPLSYVLSIRLYRDDGTYPTEIGSFIQAGSTSGTFSIDFNCHRASILYGVDSAGITVPETTIEEIMLEAGSTATAYEPFVGGQSSPSPSYPQEFRTVTGKQIVKVTGKNLFDCKHPNGMNGYIDANNKLIVSSNHPVKNIYIECEPNTTYTVSKSNAGTNQRFAVFTTNTIEGNNIPVIDLVGTKSGVDDSQNYTITTSSTAKYLFVFYSKSGESTQFYPEIRDSIQIEKGSIATEFAPFVGQTIPIDLGEIELCELSGHRDIIYKDNGRWMIYKEVGSVRINKDNSFSSAAFGTNSYTTVSPNDIMPNGSTVSIASDYFLGVSYDDRTANRNNIVYISSPNFYFRNTNWTTAEDFKEWLGEDGIKLYYIKMPTETPITDTVLIAQLEKIRRAALANGANLIQNTPEGTNLAGDIAIGYYGYNPDDYSEWRFIDGAWEQVGGRPIPSKTSDLENDSNYVNVDDIKAKLQTLVVKELPSNGENDKLYLTPKSSAKSEISGDSFELSLMPQKEALFPEIKIDGSFSQQTYTGKNLFDKNNANNLQAYVSPNGTLTGGGNQNLSVYIPCEPNTTYTVSKSNSGTNCRFCVFDTVDEPAIGVSVISTVGTRSGEDTHASYTITTSANAHYLGVFYRVTSTTPSESDIKATIQIELGSTATAFEPFVGGQSSPSPSYPQTINFATGEQEIKVRGKNLVYCLPTTSQGITSTYDSVTGVIRISGTPSTTWANFGRTNQCDLPAGNYVMSIDNTTYSCGIGIRFYYSDDSYTDVKIAKSNKKTSATFADKIVKYYIYADGMTVNTPIDFSFRLQVESGSIATDIVPYHESTYAISLGDTVLRAVGSNADEIFNDNGVWKIKRNIASYTLTDELGWAKTGNDFYCSSHLGGYSTATLNVISESLKGVIRNNITGETNYVTMSNDGNIRINIVGITTSTALLEFLAEHNIECFYVTNSPTIETIDDETLISQLDFYSGLRIDKGGNTQVVVSSTEQKVHVNVSYYAVDSDDKYDEWVYDGEFERFSGDFTPINGGYVLNGQVNPNNEIWTQWDSRLGWGMNTNTAPVPAQFNGQIYANGTIIAHNAGDKNHNRHNMHIFEGYAKDNYSRMTMLTDKHNSEFDGKKSFEMYYYTGASHKNSAYGFTKVGSDVKYHSFLFDRDKMIAAGEIDCRFPVTLARINPSTDLDSTYQTVDAADSAHEPENQAEANIKCLKYLALKNAQDGAMWYDTARNKIVVKINGEWHDMNTTAVPEGTYDF